ncbi:MAG: sulfatase-like hydrolase/transferase, partial [Lentisphaeria bacterium]|nr:sulfatase-like hydrolase/transferase [Lentisphaeria bacterium]
MAARIFLAAVFVFCLVRIRSRAAYIFMGLITLATGVVNLLDIYLLVNFGTVFDYSMWQLVRIAPSHEVSGFFRLFFCRFTTLLILLVYPLAGVIIFCIKKNRLLYITIAFSTLLLLFIFNCCGANFPRAAPDAPGKRLVSFVQQWQDSGMLRQIDISNKNLQAENTEKEALYVLVIGESHSRRRSSVYGYMRNTMPEMKKLFLQQKIFRFDDAVTPHIMTHLALPQMLTAIPPGNEKPFYEHPNILDIFRSSGFKVWYIYNQMPDESRKLPFLAIARRADKFISLSNPVKQYDSIIPDLLQKLINDPARKKFIIIHLLGNHWEYAKTFPAGMKKFKGMPPDANLSQLKKYDIVNDYDNSL